METIHPNRDSRGGIVTIVNPSWPTDPSSWTDPSCVAIATPGHATPGSINGTSFRRLIPPTGCQGWERLVDDMSASSQPVKLTAGKHASAGAVIQSRTGASGSWNLPTGFGATSGPFPKEQNHLTIPSQRLRQRRSSRRQASLSKSDHVSSTLNVAVRYAGTSLPAGSAMTPRIWDGRHRLCASYPWLNYRKCCHPRLTSQLSRD